MVQIKELIFQVSLLYSFSETFVAQESLLKGKYCYL